MTIENTEKKTDRKTTVKSKGKFLFHGDEDTQLSVQIKKKTSNLIDDYREFHKDVSSEDVSENTLISALITTGITSDKVFITWRKEKMEAKAKAEAEKKAAEAKANEADVQTESNVKDAENAIKQNNSSENSLPKKEFALEFPS